MQEVVALVRDFLVQAAQAFVFPSEPVGDGEAPCLARRLLGRLLLAGNVLLHPSNGVQGSSEVAGVVDGLGRFLRRDGGEGLDAPVQPAHFLTMLAGRLTVQRDAGVPTTIFLRISQVFGVPGVRGLPRMGTLPTPDSRKVPCCMRSFVINRQPSP